MTTVPEFTFYGADLRRTLVSLADETAALEAAVATKADASDIPQIVSFATDAEAQAYSAANPTHVALSREGA